MKSAALITILSAAIGVAYAVAILIGLTIGAGATERGQASVERGPASTFSDRVVACAPFRFPASFLGAAHRTAKCGTRLKVTNLRNGRSVVVTVIDAGPCTSTGCQRDTPHILLRPIDLYPKAAAAIGSSGLVPVLVEEMR